MRHLRSRLAWKVFLAFLIVILVGGIVLVSATTLSVPATFNRHMANMEGMMAGGSTMGRGRHMQETLFTNYRQAVFESLSLAAGAALIAAFIASFLISRQIVGPVQRMQAMSQRIAEGEYAQRLAIEGDIHLDAGGAPAPDELGQLALSFNQMAEKLEKTEEMRRRLIGDVSHELRTPLTAIKGYMEGLMDGVIPVAPDTYQQIYAEAERMGRLVDDLQELSRVEAGVVALHFSALSPEDLVATVAAHLQRAYDDKGIHLSLNVEDHLPQLNADRDRLQQVLTNLVENALHYTPSGGSVVVSARSGKAEVVFSVADNGVGIAPEHLPHLFTRFYRADKSRSRASGGTGIGLTIARALVQAHGGRIWAESPGEGKGSTFSFAIPLDLSQK